MKNFITTVMVIIGFITTFMVTNANAQSFSTLKIGNSSPINSSALLEVQGTTGAVLFPRMTTTQKNAIASPANGDLVYDTSLNAFSGYQNGAWSSIGGSVAWGSITGTLSTQTDLQTALNAKLTNPMTTSGDLIYGGASGTPTRLGVGSNTNLLTITAGLPAWEAIPTWNQNTSGNAATATALAANPTDCSSNQYANAIDASGNLTCAQVAYTQVTGTPSLSSFLVNSNNLSDVSSATASFKNIAPYTTLGDIVYENSTPTPTRLAGNTTSAKNFLTQTGTGSVSAAPAWGTIANTDLSGITNSQLSGSAAITNANLATMNTLTIKGNNTGGSSTPIDLTAAQVNALLGTFTNPMTTGGDIIYGGASGTATRLANGSANQILIAQGGTSAEAWGFLTNTNLNGSALITNANLNTMNTLTLKGNNTGGSSTPLDLTVAQVNSMLGPMTTGGDIIYGGASGIPTRLANGTANFVLTSGGGTAAPSWKSAPVGTKNYLSAYNGNTGNGNFELGATTGWTLGTTGALTNGIPTGSPTFGSGASGNLSISTVTSGSQIAGTYSLTYVSSAATTVGNMLASDAFTIDTEDQAKVMAWQFYYKAVTNPSNANWTGTSSNSLAVAIYDVTNSAWIIPQGNFSLIQSSGVGLASGTFQTSATGTSYRFVIYNANATAGAITDYFDDVQLGPSSSAGSILNTLIASAHITSGTTIVTPNPFNFDTIDTDTTASITTGASWKFTAPFSTYYYVETTLTFGGAADVVLYKNGAKYRVLMTTGASGSAGGTFVQLNAGDNIYIAANANAAPSTTSAGTIAQSNHISIFIIGNQGAGPAGLVVASSAHNTTGSITSAAQVNFDTVDLDTTASISTGASWKYTAPYTGNYVVEASLYSGGTSFAYSVFKNGSIYRAVGIGNSATGPQAGGTIVPCNAGDTLDIRPNASATLSGLTGVTAAQTNYINIFLLQGPSGGSVTAQPVYLAATGTYSIPQMNAVISFSGASATETLPTAVGFPGRTFTLIHNGTSLTQLYSLATTGGQTIGGIASGSYILSTAGESLSIISDGANYQVTHHDTFTSSISAGSIAISATSAYVFSWTGSQSIVIGDTYSDGTGKTFTVSATSNTTTGTFSGTGTPATTGTLTRVTGTGVASITWTSRTITGAPAFGAGTNTVTWSRDGAYATITYTLNQTGAGTAGSGDLLFYTPTNMVINTTNFTPLLTSIGSNLLAITTTQLSALPTSGSSLVNSGSATLISIAYLYSGTSFRIANLSESAGAISGGNWSSSYFPLSGTTLGASFTITVPISGWQP